MLKKRMTALLLLIMVFGCMASLGESDLPGDNVFADAKNALRFMSEKKPEQAINALGANDWLSASKLRQTIDTGCRHLYTIRVETEYAVAWRSANGLFMAIPVEEPVDGYVDTLVLKMDDSFAFTALTFKKWGDVDKELRSAYTLRWCEEYRPSYRVFVD